MYCLFKEKSKTQHVNWRGGDNSEKSENRQKRTKDEAIYRSSSE